MALELDQKPGCCAFCDGPLPPPCKRKPCTVCCRDPDCKREYLRTYAAQRIRHAKSRLRRVVSQRGIFQRLVCGHFVVARTARQQRLERRRCVTCGTRP